MNIVYCHDAGPANILAANIETKDSKFYASGPAIEIFRKKGIEVGNKEKIPSIDIENFYCGTSLESKYHLSLIEKFKNKGVKTIACIEHWKNYEKRFLYNEGKFVMPNIIQVFDERAYKMVQGIEILNKNCKVELIRNKYRDDIVDRIAREHNKQCGKRFDCYISEPASRFSKGKKIIDEIDCFKALLAYLTNQYIQKDYYEQELKMMGVCLHPAESIEKGVQYKNIAAEYNIETIVFNSLEEVNFAYIQNIYGRDSMGLELTAEAGISTFSVLSKNSPYRSNLNPKILNLSLC